MKYNLKDKFKDLKNEERRGIIVEYYEETNDYKLKVFDEKDKEGYEHFASEEELDNEWKQDNRLSVQDYHD